MSKKSFREDISKLDFGESKEYKAQIISEVSESGQKEKFYVDVFRTRKMSPSRGNFKLQWTRKAKPELPTLKTEIERKAREKFKNRAYLTSGFGYNKNNSNTQGIKDIDTLLLMIEELKNLGIIIRI